MNLYSETAKWDNVKLDFEAIKFHALKYLMGSRSLLARSAYQHVKQMETMNGVTINLWGNSENNS